MRRRRFLALAAGAPVTGAFARRTTEGGGFGPLGRVEVAGAKEAVLAADGETAYLATTDGFLAVDVSDPRDPEVLAARTRLLADHPLGPLEQVFDVAVSGERLLVAGPANPVEGGLQGVASYDVGDPARPERLGFHPTSTPVHNVALEEGVGYLTANDGADNPLVVLDLETGRELGRWSPVDHDAAWAGVPAALRPLHDVQVAGGTAYLAYWDAGTWLVDVRDPTAPSVLAHVRGGDPTALAGLSREERERAALEPPGNDHFATVDPGSGLVGVGAEAWDAVAGDGRGGPGGLELWDVSTPGAPERRARIDPPPTPDPTRGGVWTTAHNFHLVDGRLYSAWYAGGVRVHDVSDPGVPRAVAAWRDSAAASFWSAHAGPGGSFFVASSWRAPGDTDSSGGLYTFPDPAVE